MLEIFFNLHLNANYKQSKFLKAFLKKGFELDLDEKSGIVIFHLSFILLSAKIYFFLNKRNRKKDTLVARNIGHVKTILTLLAKVVAERL